jgi:hypothetical protein
VGAPNSGFALAGAAEAAYCGVPVSDPHQPGIFGVVQHGVIYADQPDIEQHGGADFHDVSIPILVDLDLPGQRHAATNGAKIRPTLTQNGIFQDD